MYCFKELVFHGLRIKTQSNIIFLKFANIIDYFIFLIKIISECNARAPLAQLINNN